MANLVKCPTCQRDVSSEARACPQCGHQFKAAGGINLKDPIHVIGILLAVVVLGLYLAHGCLTSP